MRQHVAAHVVGRDYRVDRGHDPHRGDQTASDRALLDLATVALILLSWKLLRVL